MTLDVRNILNFRSVSSIKLLMVLSPSWKTMKPLQRLVTDSTPIATQRGQYIVLQK